MPAELIAEVDFGRAFDLSLSALLIDYTKMARTASSSDGESISAPVKSKVSAQLVCTVRCLTQPSCFLQANKENQAFSLTTTGEHDGTSEGLDVPSYSSH